MWRTAILPVLAPFVLVVVSAVVALREPTPRPPATPIRDRRQLGRFLRVLAGTLAGGYVMFLAIVVVFHVGLVGLREDLVAVAGEGAALLLVSAAAFALAQLGVGRTPLRGRRR
jgi:hypothetical protein